ncbi:unnamed protein product [Vicia faba]|uniref:Dof-type domain-containing protein n=1 Tax=Vicia faba TaxID=3906 RepID=A0AAV1AWL1_VICFA|nr:unnamed protein product [Vicia faba]
MNMSETETEKNPGIKLFGWKIPLPECRIPVNSPPMDTCSSTKKTLEEKVSAEKTEQRDDSSNSMDSKQESRSNTQEKEPIVNSEQAEDNMESGDTDQDKILKKPDKIVQCPRCRSWDTKFCYFNNYNVNQPRHFCKNCQRYWTAGGTMRNVPIGAGRRKNKHLASQYRQVIVNSDGIPISRQETTSLSGHQRAMTDNETVLKFGPDTPLCESMHSMLNVRDHNRRTDANSISNVLHREEPTLCGSSVANTDTHGNKLSEHNAPNWLHCYPVPPWVLPMNPGWTNATSMAAVHPTSVSMCNPYSAAPTSMQWCPAPMFAIPGIRPQDIPLQLVSASHWNGPSLCLSPPSSTSNSCSGNGSPTLGKHTRDTVSADEDKSDKCIPVRKTTKIEVANEVPKSPNGEGKNIVLGASQILEA